MEIFVHWTYFVVEFASGHISHLISLMLDVHGKKENCLFLLDGCLFLISCLALDVFNHFKYDHIFIFFWDRKLKTVISLSAIYVKTEITVTVCTLGIQISGTFELQAGLCPSFTW
jgi:hypothetical protein